MDDKANDNIPIKKRRRIIDDDEDDDDNDDDDDDKVSNDVDHDEVVEKSSKPPGINDILASTNKGGEKRSGSNVVNVARGRNPPPPPLPRATTPRSSGGARPHPSPSMMTLTKNICAHFAMSLIRPVVMIHKIHHFLFPFANIDFAEYASGICRGRRIVP